MIPPADTLSSSRSNPEGEFPRHAGDPVARFLREKLHAGWPHLFVAAFVLYGPIEKLILPTVGEYITLGPDVKAWRPDVETLVLGFVVFPLFFAIYLWIGEDISRVFKSLKENEAFKNEARFVQFVERARQAFERREAWIAGILIALGFAMVVNFVLFGKDSLPAWFDDVRGPLLFPRMVSFLMVAMLGYAASQIIIREAMAIIWWRRMWLELDDLVLHPYHPDGAAGLGAIGTHAIGISYFLLAVTLWGFIGSLIPSLRYGNKVIYAATDEVTVKRTDVRVPRPDRPVSYAVLHDLSGRPLVKFAPRRMALADARALHMRVVRMPAQTVAMDEWFSIDSLRRIPVRISQTVFGRICNTASLHQCSDSQEVRIHNVWRVSPPKPIPMQADSERFAVSLASTPLPGHYPTLRIAGIPMSLWNPLLLLLWILVLLVVGLSLGPLLWPAHAAMVRWLDKQLKALSKDLDEHTQAANDARGNDAAKFQVATEAIERTKQIRKTLLDDCKTWPISDDTRRRLGVSTGLSVGSSVVNLITAAGLNLVRQLT